MTTKYTVNEVMESLSGFDEIAIEQSLHFDLYTQGEQKPVMLVRALVFVLKRRDGLSDHEARQAALEMPVSAVNDYFAEEADEIDPEQPDTVEGKGDSLPVDAPTS